MQEYVDDEECSVQRIESCSMWPMLCSIQNNERMRIVQLDHSQIHDENIQMGNMVTNHYASMRWTCKSHPNYRQLICTESLW